jgi:hypothetical protein
MALRARHETRREGLRVAATCAAVRPRGRLREPPRRGCEQSAALPGLALLDGLCTRRQHVRFRVHSPSPTFRGLRVVLCTARASRPPDSGLCTDGLCPPVSPDHDSSCDLESSLKLRSFGAREKGIRGGDADPRFQSASLPVSLVVGRRSRRLFGTPEPVAALHLRVPLPLRRWRSSGPLLRRYAPCPRTPRRGVLGCLAPMPVLRFAPPRTLAVSRPSRSASRALPGWPSVVAEFPSALARSWRRRGNSSQNDYARIVARERDPATTAWTSRKDGGGASVIGIAPSRRSGNVLFTRG